MRIVPKVRMHHALPVTFLVLCCLLFSKLANAQTQTWQHFETAFAKLSEQGQVTFVIEGTPLHPELTDEQANELVKVLATLPKDKQGNPTDFDALVSTVASAYDYDAFRPERGRRKSQKVFALSKRYTDPEDLPFITLEEASASLRNISRATQNLVPENA